MIPTLQSKKVQANIVQHKKITSKLQVRTWKITHSSDKNIQQNTHSSGKDVENTKSRPTAEISPKPSNLRYEVSFHRQIDKSPNFC